MTHQVVRVDGSRLTLKGDANNVVDDAPVTVAGADRVSLRLPKLGYPIAWATTPAGLVVAGSAAAIHRAATTGSQGGLRRRRCLTWTFPMSNLSPDDAVAATVPITNGGTLPLKFTATGTGTGSLTELNVTTAFGTGASVTNGTSGGKRTGSCNGNPGGDVKVTSAGASRATSAYYTSTATATSTVTSSVKPNELVLTCKYATGNDLRFSWTSIANATYPIHLGSASATTTAVTYDYAYSGKTLQDAYVTTTVGGQLIESNRCSSASTNASESISP